jgi:acyl-CoA thioesterase-2
MKVLVAVDFSDPTDIIMRVATRLAAGLAADVWIVHVGDPEPDLSRSPFELRVVDPSEFEVEQPRDPMRQIWIRPRGVLPDDPALHTATLVYATDRTLLSTVLRAHGRFPGHIAMGASLDHAVWLHRPIRFDDWLLYATVSPISFAARGLIFGSLYRRDGVQLASVAQEALIREKRRAGAGAENQDG